MSTTDPIEGFENGGPRSGSVWVYFNDRWPIFTFIEVEGWSVYGKPEGWVELDIYTFRGFSLGATEEETPIPDELRRITLNQFKALAQQGRIRHIYTHESLSAQPTP